MWRIVVVVALCGTTTATDQRPTPPSEGLVRLPTTEPLSTTISYGEPRSYCEAETFRPSCEPGKVVRIGIAKYGRQERNRCVDVDYGYIGCVVDVLNYVDAKCSGRRQCEIRIPDSKLDENVQCPEDLKTYLNVSYACVKVETQACASCRQSGFAKVMLPSAYLASATASSNNKCGASSCPWLIEVQPGQKIQLTLLDFASTVSTSYVSGVPCAQYRYGMVREAGDSQLEGTPICGGVHGTHHVYTSVRNSITVMVTPLASTDKGQFLLHYQAVGCPSLKKVPNAWIKREDDKVTINCNSSNAKWEMKCEGTTWIGEKRTCPQDHKSKDYHRPENMSLPLGVLVAIVIGIALIVGVLILTIGVVFLKRQQHELTARHGGATLYYRAPQTPPHLLEEIEVVEQAPPECTCPKPSGSRRRWDKHQQPSAQRVNLYARRMETRPLPSLPNLAESESEGAELVPVQFYRTHSGHREHRPHCIAAAAAAAAGPPIGVDPQYFELDPESGEARLPSAQAARRAARAANARTAARTMARGKGGHRQKSPEEENAENFNKEEHLNGSCQEFPLKSNKNAATKATDSSGSNNYSWP